MSTIHQQVSRDQMYTALLDASVLGTKGRPSTKQLGYLFESVLPVPLESIHTAYRLIGGSKYFACGVDRELLKQALAEGAVTLTPSALPEGMKATFTLSHLNLLTGTFEPSEVRRLRGRQRWLSVVSVLILITLVLTGLNRRISHHDDSVRTMESNAREAIAAVLGASAKTHPHPDLLVVSERRLLEQTRAVGSTGTDPLTELESGDVSLILADFLAVIPQDVPLRLESLVVSPQTITLAGETESSDHAQRLADPLATLDAAGWVLQQPRFETRKDGVSFSLRLTHKKDPS